MIATKKEALEFLAENYHFTLDYAKDLSKKYNFNETQTSQLINLVNRTYFKRKIVLLVEDRLDKIMSGFFNRASRCLEKSLK